MKKTILILAGLAFFVTKIFAQTEWAPIGAKWVSQEDRWEDGMFFLITFESIKDTTMLGKNCSKIQSYIYCRNRFANDPRCKSEKDSSVFYISSENNKIYYSNGDSFILMYDFTLNKGDTFSIYQRYRYYADSFKFQRYLIDKIDSVKISNHYLKRQHLHNIDTINIIWYHYIYQGDIVEKIGCLYYFFGRYFDPIDNSPPHLKCYNDKEISYKDSFALNCNGFDAVNTYSNQQKIEIYPNPATDKVNIECDIRQDLNMQVYNTVGQCVLHKELNQQTNAIDISSLTKGIYILKLTSPNRTYEKKIIKE